MTNEWRNQMSENRLRVLARVSAKASSMEQVRTILIGLVDATRKEPGCLSYQFLQNRSDPNGSKQRGRESYLEAKNKDSRPLWIASMVQAGVNVSLARRTLIFPARFSICARS